jgi:hypothetical protein
MSTIQDDIRTKTNTSVKRDHGNHYEENEHKF